MPNCSAKNESSLAMVEEDSVIQICKNSRWETLGHPYANEDSLPNCTKKREGEKAYLMEENEVQVCEDGIWSTLGKASDSSSETDDEGNDEGDDSGDVQTTKISDNDENDSNSDTKTKSSSSHESTSDEKVDSSSSESSNASTNIAPGVKEGTFTDPRDSQKYRTTIIGNQEWFAQNLNYDTDDSNSLCPLEDLSYCEKYGRLYKTASHTNCPTGWHVPYQEEWEALFSYVEENSGGEGVGKSLKATSGWYEAGYVHTGNADGSERVAVETGDDMFRFSALPAGSCWGDRCYSDDDSHFWSKNKNNGYEQLKKGYKVALDEDDIVEEIASSGALSIRCIKTKLVEIDSLPESVTIIGIEVTSENVTHEGVDEFDELQAWGACPRAWRLPTYREMYALSHSSIFYTPLLDTYGTGTQIMFHVFDSDGLGVKYVSNGGNLEVVTYDSQSSHDIPKYVRCVKE